MAPDVYLHTKFHCSTKLVTKIVMNTKSLQLHGTMIIDIYIASIHACPKVIAIGMSDRGSLPGLFTPRITSY